MGNVDPWRTLQSLARGRGAEPNITFTYDLFNRLLTQGDGSQTLSFTYDQLSRNLTQQSSVLGTVSYQYDAARRRTRMDWPGAAPNDLFVTYDYNPYDEMTAIREKGAMSGAGVLAVYTYDNLGRRTLLTRGNSTGPDPNTETLTYDASFNLDTLTQNLTGASHDETITLDYNGVGQITDRISSDADFQWTPIAPGATSYTDNGLNQYTAVGGASYSYDTRGNLTGDGSRTYGRVHAVLRLHPQPHALRMNEPSDMLFKYALSAALLCLSSCENTPSVISHDGCDYVQLETGDRTREIVGIRRDRIASISRMPQGDAYFIYLHPDSNANVREITLSALGSRVREPECRSPQDEGITCFASILEPPLELRVVYRASSSEELRTRTAEIAAHISQNTLCTRSTE